MTAIRTKWESLIPSIAEDILWLRGNWKRNFEILDPCWWRSTIIESKMDSERNMTSGSQRTGKMLKNFCCKLFRLLQMWHVSIPYVLCVPKVWATVISTGFHAKSGTSQWISKVFYLHPCPVCRREEVHEARAISGWHSVQAGSTRWFRWERKYEPIQATEGWVRAVLKAPPRIYHSAQKDQC